MPHMSAYDTQIPEDVAEDLLLLAEALGFQEPGTSLDFSIASLLKALSQLEPEDLQTLLNSYGLLP